MIQNRIPDTDIHRSTAAMAGVVGGVRHRFRTEHKVARHGLKDGFGVVSSHTHGADVASPTTRASRAGGRKRSARPEERQRRRPGA
jgi:hypothetical protein